MALNTTMLLRGVQQFKRYYARQFDGVLKGSDLTMREMDVVLFLANNPRCDTARQSSAAWGLAKSQVSGAVELLCRKGLLRRMPDGADRRVVHLSLTDGGQALAREGRQVQAACLEDAVLRPDGGGGGRVPDPAGEGVGRGADAVPRGGGRMRDSKNVDLGSGSVGKLLFSLAVPTITSQIVNMLYNLVDRIYIGHMQPAETVGKLALTGVGVCLPIIMVISAFAALLAFGGAPRASIAEGRGDLKESERIMGNSLTLLVGASVVLTAVFLAFAEPMLLLFGASGNTVGYALDYMRIYALGTIFVQVTLGMNAYITAQGFTTVSMKTVLIGAVLNTILDPVFIFAFGMGGAGRGPGHHFVPGGVGGVGAAVPHRAEDQVAPAAGEPPPPGEGGAAGPGSGPLALRHAVHGEPDHRLLQLLAAQVRRGHRRGGHDGALQHHAVRHDAPPGADSGGPAHHQLQLRRPGPRPGAAGLSGAADGLRRLFPGALGPGAPVPGALRPDVHPGR